MRHPRQARDDHAQGEPGVGKCPLTVDLPIENCGFSIVVLIYQRVDMDRGLVNVTLAHHPNVGGTISNRDLKVI